MDALTTYRLYSSDPDRAIERVSSKPQVAREVQYYKDNIAGIKSIDDLVADSRIFNFTMQAYGLGEMSYAKAFIRKLLEGGVDDDNAMANRLTDIRYKQLATDLNFTRYGEATTAFTKISDGVIDKFYQQSLEEDAGGQNNGVRLALYFQRKAEDVENQFSILADPALLQFVQTAFGLPTAMSFLSIDKQAALISEKLDIEDLSNKDKLEDLTNRFLVLWDISNPDAVAVPPLISAPTGIQNLSLDLLYTLQKIR